MVSGGGGMASWGQIKIRGKRKKWKRGKKKGGKWPI